MAAVAIIESQGQEAFNIDLEGAVGFYAGLAGEFDLQVELAEFA